MEDTCTFVCSKRRVASSLTSQKHCGINSAWENPASATKRKASSDSNGYKAPVENAYLFVYSFMYTSSQSTKRMRGLPPSNLQFYSISFTRESAAFCSATSTVLTFFSISSRAYQKKESMVPISEKW